MNQRPHYQYRYTAYAYYDRCELFCALNSWMAYWPNKLPVPTVQTTSDSSDVEGYSQFNKGERRPEVCALLFELAPTDIEIFYRCKATMLMFVHSCRLTF